MTRFTVALTGCAFTALCSATAQSAAGQDYVIRNFRFESGEVLPELRIHYFTMGRPVRDAAGVVRNAVLFMHGTNGSGGGFAAGTWNRLTGPGRVFDTTKYYIVVPDGIGHGRSSKPSDGLRARFPKYTYNDMVLAEHELLTKGLGVNHLRVMLGTSMGCMHAWMWGERYPTFTDGLIPLACMPTAIVGRNRWRRKLTIEVIRTDPDYNNGDYTKALAGMRIARAIQSLTSNTPKMMQQSFPTSAAADSSVVQALTNDGSEDPNDFIWAVDASRNYDPSKDLETITARVLTINSADDFLNPPELEIVERLITRVKQGRYVLLPITDETRGHVTHSMPQIWGRYVEEFMANLPQQP
jgi:homoserine O-acetyltransferase